jgi:type I restriction enzyme S subunit
MENGKSAIATGLLKGYGYGSTEYHVIRKRTESILIEYIYYLLRLKLIRNAAAAHFTGSAGQQRVPKAFLENLIVPVPTINEQKKIITKLNNLKYRKKRCKDQSSSYFEKALKEFIKVVF